MRAWWISPDRRDAGKLLSGYLAGFIRIEKRKNIVKSHLDEKFIEAQRERLEALSEQLQNRGAPPGGDNGIPQDQRATGVKDSGEQGASEAGRSRREALGAQSQVTLGAVRRALEKIEEGSYGFSDESDEPIPRARLEAVPQANLTVEEEEDKEQRDRVLGN